MNKKDFNNKNLIENAYKILDGKIIGNIVLPVILVVFGFCKIGRGIEFADTGYNYGNFVYLSNLDNMWFCSTFLSCVTGRLFTFLPFGHTLIGLNFYTSIFKVAIALAAYFFARKTLKISSGITFFAELIALGLCWCPTALVYNYLSYLLFFLGTIFLYKALTEGRDRLLVVAGICLGTNVFVRFPNLCEMALIVGLFYWCIINKVKLIDCAKKTGLCILGYFGSAVFWVTIISLIKGPSSYITAITELFSMTGEAADYSGQGMLYGIYCAFRNSLYYQKFLVILFILSFILWYAVNWLIEKRNMPKETAKTLHSISAAIIVLMSVTVLAYMYRVNHFTFDYQETSSFYWPGACVLGISIVMFIVIAFMKNQPANLRLAAVLSLIVIAITPLGTNNEIYASCNNLFFVLPVLFYVIKNIPNWKGALGFKLAFVLYICFFAYQSINFGFTYTFGDGKEMSQSLQSSVPAVKYVKTQSNKAMAMDEVAQILVDKDRKVLIFGDVPGVAFYYELEPAISSSWPSLQSYSTGKYAGEMEELQASIDNGSKLPYIAIDPAVYELLLLHESDDAPLGNKEKRLYEFIKDNNYEVASISPGLMVVYDAQ